MVFNGRPCEGHPPTSRAQLQVLSRCRTSDSTKTREGTEHIPNFYALGVEIVAGVNRLKTDGRQRLYKRSTMSLHQNRTPQQNAATSTWDTESTMALVSCFLSLSCGSRYRYGCWCGQSRGQSGTGTQTIPHRLCFGLLLCQVIMR